MAYNYWRDTYGKRSKDFIEGVIAAMETYAIWRDGKRYLGVIQQPLDEAILEAKEGMGYPEGEVADELQMTKRDK